MTDKNDPNADAGTPDASAPDTDARDAGAPETLPTEPILDTAPEPAPEPAATAADAQPSKSGSVLRPILIGAAAGIGVLLLGGVGIATVAAFNGLGPFDTVPAAVAGPDSSPQGPGDDRGGDRGDGRDDGDRGDDRGRDDNGPVQSDAGDPAALVGAIDTAVAAAGGTGASSVEVESRGWSVDVILADGTEVDVRVSTDGTATVRADHRDDDADPALDTGRISDIAAAAIAAAGGSGVVVGIESESDDSHAYSVKVAVGSGDRVEVKLTDSLDVAEVEDDR